MLGRRGISKCAPEKNILPRTTEREKKRKTQKTIDIRNRNTTVTSDD